MKRNNQTKLLSLVAVVLLILSCLCSCNKTQNVNGYCTVVVDGETPKEYSVDLDKVTVDKGLISVLDYLKKEQGLTYTGTESSMGTYLTQVDGLKEDKTSGTYIYIWTSVEKDFDVSAYATTKEYGGKKLTSSGVGATSMTIENGAMIYIGTIKY